MGVRGTSVPIQIWNLFPYGENSLPSQVYPEPRSDRQITAIEKLMAYLEDIHGGQNILQAFLDITVPDQPINDFWVAATNWQEMTQSIIPQGSITYQNVYNVRTHEAEQGTNLRYLAYADTSLHQTFHIGIVRRQSQAHVIHTQFLKVAHIMSGIFSREISNQPIFLSMATYYPNNRRNSL